MVVPSAEKSKLEPLRIIVTKANLESVAEKLSYKARISIDTETTGLKLYGEDRLFGLSIACDNAAYYFNFKKYESSEPFAAQVLDYADLKKFWFVWQHPHRLWYAHNAKFDLTALKKEGVELAGDLHCTWAAAKLIKNNNLNYGLDALAKEVGFEKSKAVDEYIKKHKLYHWETPPGKNKRVKIPHYVDVPFDIMSQYALQDAWITYQLGEMQVAKLKAMDQEYRKSEASLLAVYENEKKLTKVCFAMEQEGIKINRPYVLAAAGFYDDLVESFSNQFSELSGEPFKDSNKALALAFRAAGEEIKHTLKGNPSFTDDILEEMTSPLANLLRGYRDARKKSQTYFRNFLWFADPKGFIHPNMKQAGTDTGRFSYSDPNLQNLPKEEDPELPYKVRNCFIPPGEDFCLTMIDYKQMEYRLMLDYAGEHSIISQVKEGMDVHEATGNLMGVSRGPAKTLNFMLLYGGGVQKLADSLKISFREAEDLRRYYFSKLPNVRNFTEQVTARVKARRYIFNWMGRIYYFGKPFYTSEGKLVDPAFKGPNYIIQGGCADIVKVAMNSCHSFLQNRKSKMLLQVHDELLFAIHKDEFHLVPTLRILMESAYIPRYLHLACDVDHSWVSWGDKIKGYPNANNKPLPGINLKNANAKKSQASLLDMARAESPLSE